MNELTLRLLCKPFTTSVWRVKRKVAFTLVIKSSIVFLILISMTLFGIKVLWCYTYDGADDEVPFHFGAHGDEEVRDNFSDSMIIHTLLYTSYLHSI